MTATIQQYNKSVNGAYGIGLGALGEEICKSWGPLYQERGIKKSPVIRFFDNVDAWKRAVGNQILRDQANSRGRYGEFSLNQSIGNEDLDDLRSLRIGDRLHGDSRRQFAPPRSLDILRDRVGPWDEDRVFGRLCSWPSLAGLEQILALAPLIDREEWDGEDLDIERCATWHGAINSVWAASMGSASILVLMGPKSVKIDANNELHCENGPAMELADGQEMWALHGVELPVGLRTKQERQSASIGDLLTISDHDVREVVCADRGWAEIAQTIGAVTIEDSRNPHWGKLVDLWIPGGPRRFLDAMCGTGRRVLVPVSNQISTVNDAQSALHGGVPFWVLQTAKRRT